MNQSYERLVHEPIDDAEGKDLLGEAQGLIDALAPSIGEELHGYARDINATDADDAEVQWLRVTLAAANATLTVCAERIAQDALLTHLSTASLN